MTTLLNAYHAAAPGKLNLTLRVHGRLPDGYHALESLVAFVSLADTVTWEPAPARTTVQGPFAEAITGENLLDRLMSLLHQQDPALAQGHFTIHKMLPVAGGLGGGSADAGAALRLLERQCVASPETIDWVALAAGLGSDVPVCYRAQPCIIASRGTTMAPVPQLPGLPLVLVNPAVAVPSDKTARVFAALAARPIDIAPEPALDAYQQINTRDGLLALMVAHGNDLTAASIAVCPSVHDVLTELERLPGVLHTAVTGAGPTCFAVLPDAGAAQAARDAVADRHPDWWVIATETQAHPA